MLHHHLESCIIAKSKIKGINKEASQAAFFKLTASGMADLTEISRDHQLTMWMSLQVFGQLMDTSDSVDSCPGSTVTPVTSEEADIASYIGGVCCQQAGKENQIEQ